MSAGPAHAAPAEGTAAIIGLGLIGGSLARDLAARGMRVLGHDVDVGRLVAARASGVLAGDTGDGGDALGGLTAAEVVVLAVPVSEAPSLLRAARPYLGGARLITDVGSTKRAVVRAATELGLGDRFVGSHPLAGDHRSGWEASRVGLFRDVRVFLTPAHDASPAALRMAHGLWRSVGAHPELLDAAEHDARLALSSHLPQVASTALALTLAGARVPRGALGPGGRDATRLAGSDAAMWAAIAAENADELGPAIGALERRLAELRGAVGARDLDALRGLFADARRWADAPDEPT